VTYQLPWNIYFQKGHIQLYPNGFCLTSIDDPSEQHIFPSKTINSMAERDEILLEHHHNIRTQPQSTHNIDSTPPV